MATKITQLNYVKTSENLKIFDVVLSNNNTSSEHVVYIADNGKSTYGNITCDNDTICNIYRSNKVFYKSAQKITSSGKTSTYDYNDIFLHEMSSQINNVVQVNNVFYTYTDKDTFGSYLLNSDIYDYISADTGHITPQDINISTLLFNKDLTIKSNIENIQYNKLLEMPGFYENDYDSGNIIANNYKLKNHYSGLYNMEHNKSYILLSCRNYTGIGSFNNNIYLKYHDNINYEKNNIRIGNTQTYEKIEVLHSLNRQNSTQKHKTNLFSVKIDANLQTENNINESDKDKFLILMRNQIKNIVRSYVNKLKPANTQLFLVTVDNK